MNLLAKDMETRVFLLASIGSFLFPFLLLWFSESNIKTPLFLPLILFFIFLRLSFEKKSYFYGIILSEFILIFIIVHLFVIYLKLGFPVSHNDMGAIILLLGAFSGYMIVVMVQIIFSAIIAIPLAALVKKYIQKTSSTPSSEKNTTI